ncbi:MAG: carboxypeptidase-like regulatory domain-containing protein, partial [Planctomycetota bacterium]
APLYRNRLLEFKTGAHGRVRASVDPSRCWSAWAVWDGEGKRLASPLVPGILPGRPLRLVLQPFEAFNVRWIGLDAWRKLFGEKLRTVFISDKSAMARPAPPAAVQKSRSVSRASGSTAPGAGFIPPVFHLPLPGSDQEVVRLPPLPLGRYYPVLADAEGGFLDTRYMNPSFLTSQTVQHMYERKRFLKRQYLGRPVRAPGRLVGHGGKPVSAADLFLRPRRGQLEHERRYATDSDGSFELILTFRDKRTDSTGTFSYRVFVLAPGFRPELFSLGSLGKEQPSPIRFTLTPGEDLDWRVRNPEPGDHERFFLSTEIATRSTGKFPHTFPLRCDANGRLGLPAPYRTPSGPPAWYLVLVRDGKPIPLLLSDRATIPAEQDLDLAKLKRVELQVETESGRRARGGIVLLGASRQTSRFPLRYPVDLKGRTSFRAMPGRYFLTVRHPQHGSGFLDLAVGEDALSKTVQLARPARR